MIRVLFDCDGVLSDFVGGWLRLINAQFGTEYDVEDVTGWDVCASLGIPGGKRGIAKRLLAECDGFANKLDVLPGAIDGVRRLREIAEVYIVTSSWDSHPTWEYDRKAWLKRHFDIHSNNVIFAHDKHVCVGDVLVDDKTETCRLWQAAHPSGIAVLWRAPHNQRDAWDGPATCSWDELIGFVDRSAATKETLALAPVTDSSLWRRLNRVLARVARNLRDRELRELGYLDLGGEGGAG